jgi:hypothetical protein
VRYDPMATPEPSQWLASSEWDRLDAVLRQHKGARERSGSERVHAAVHVAVENQLAEGAGPAVSAMDRLLREGLDRHEALHAIGSLVAGQIFGAPKHGAVDNEAYANGLETLTAESWRRSADEE